MIFKTLSQSKRLIYTIGVLFIFFLSSQVSGILNLFWFYLILIAKAIISFVMLLPLGIVQLLFGGNLIVLTPQNLFFFFIAYAALGAFFCYWLGYFIYKVLTFKGEYSQSIAKTLRYWNYSWYSFNQVLERFTNFAGKNPFFSAISAIIILATVYSGAMASTSKYVVLPSTYNGSEIKSAKISTDNFKKISSLGNNDTSISVSITTEKETKDIICSPTSKDCIAEPKKFNTLGELFDYSISKIPYSEATKTKLITDINKEIANDKELLALTAFYKINKDTIANDVFDSTSVGLKSFSMQKELNNGFYDGYTFTKDKVKLKMIGLIPNLSERGLRYTYFFLTNAKYFLYSNEFSGEIFNQSTNGNTPNMNGVLSKVFGTQEQASSITAMKDSFNWFLLLMVFFLTGFYTRLLVLYMYFYRTILGKEFNFTASSGAVIEYKFKDDVPDAKAEKKEVIRIKASDLMKEGEDGFHIADDEAIEKTLEGKKYAVDYLNKAINQDAFTIGLQDLNTKFKENQYAKQEQIQHSLEKEAELLLIQENAKKLEELSELNKKEEKEEETNYLLNTLGKDVLEIKEDDTPEMKAIKTEFKVLEKDYFLAKNETTNLKNKIKDLEAQLVKEEQIKEVLIKLSEFDSKEKEYQSLIDMNPANESEYLPKLQELRKQKIELLKGVEDFGGNIGELSLLNNEIEEFDKIPNVLEELKKYNDFIEAKQYALDSLDTNDIKFKEKEFLFKKELAGLKTKRDEIEEQLLDSTSLDRIHQIEDINSKIAEYTEKMKGETNLNKKNEYEAKIKDLEEEKKIKSGNISKVGNVLKNLYDVKQELKLKNDILDLEKQSSLKSKLFNISNSKKEYLDNKNEIQSRLEELSVLLLNEDLEPEERDTLVKEQSSLNGEIKSLEFERKEYLKEEYDELKRVDSKNLSAEMKDELKTIATDVQSSYNDLIYKEKIKSIEGDILANTNKLATLNEEDDTEEYIKLTNDIEGMNLELERYNEKIVNNEFVKTEEELEAVLQDIALLNDSIEQKKKGNEHLLSISDEQLEANIQEKTNELFELDIKKEKQLLVDNEAKLNLEEFERNKTTVENLKIGIPPMKEQLEVVEKDESSKYYKQLNRKHEIMDVDYKSKDSVIKEEISNELNKIKDTYKDKRTKEINEWKEQSGAKLAEIRNKLEEEQKSNTEITLIALKKKKLELEIDSLISDRKSGFFKGDDFVLEKNNLILAKEEEIRTLNLSKEIINIERKIEGDKRFQTFQNISDALLRTDINNPDYNTYRNQFLGMKKEVLLEKIDLEKKRRAYDDAFKTLFDKQKAYKEMENKSKEELFQEEETRKKIERLEAKILEDNVEERLEIIQFIDNTTKILEKDIKVPNHLSEAKEALSSEKKEISYSPINKVENKEDKKNVRDDSDINMEDLQS